jgi:hypothetical protein
MSQTHTNPAYFCALTLGFRSRWKQTRLYNKIRINFWTLFTILLFHTNQDSLMTSFNLYSTLKWLVKPPCIICKHMLKINKKALTPQVSLCRNMLLPTCCITPKGSHTFLLARLRVGRPKNCDWIPGRRNSFTVFSKTSTLTLETTQPHI